MIRALWDGRKTMTRRLLRGAVPEAPAMDAIHPSHTARHPTPYLDAYCSERKTGANPRGMGRNWCWWTRDDRACAQFKVGFVPGDRLWVRESICELDRDHRPPRFAYKADTAPGSEGDEIRKQYGYKWTPSIHMPRIASRLTLTVTAVKIERLQDISKDDCIAEGMVGLTDVHAGWHQPFAEFWDCLHGKGAWDQNPWLIALTFTVHKTNIDAMPKAQAA